MTSCLSKKSRVIKKADPAGDHNEESTSWRKLDWNTIIFPLDIDLKLSLPNFFLAFKKAYKTCSTSPSLNFKKPPKNFAQYLKNHQWTTFNLEKKMLINQGFRWKGHGFHPHGYKNPNSRKSLKFLIHNNFDPKNFFLDFSAEKLVESYESIPVVKGLICFL